MSDERETMRDEEGGQAKPARKGPGMPMILGLVLGSLLLVGGGVTAAVMLLRPPAAQAAGDSADALPPDQVAAPEIPPEGGAFYTIDEAFIVNLDPTDPAPYTYLKFAIALEVKDTAAADALHPRLPKIKAVINGIMNNVAYTAIASEAGQKKYALRIREALNTALTPAPDPKSGKLPPPPVFHAYFTTLVAQ